MTVRSKELNRIHVLRTNPRSGSISGAANAQGGRRNSVSAGPGAVSKPRKQGRPPHRRVGIGAAPVRSCRLADRLQGHAQRQRVAEVRLAACRGRVALVL